MSTSLDRFAARMTWIRVMARGILMALIVFLAFLVASVLTGCAEFRAVQTGVATHGAQAADAAMSTAKWEVCTATTVGALERELGGDKARTFGWMLFCDKKPGHPLTPSGTDAPVVPQGGRPLTPQGLGGREL